jgi:hypothetical protein
LAFLKSSLELCRRKRIKGVGRSEFVEMEVETIRGVPRGPAVTSSRL